MKKEIGVCVGLLLIGFGAARTAEAQTAYDARGFLDPALPPHEIISLVRSSGLRPLTRPMRRGPNYVLVAIDRAGRQMRVAVDAQLGDIVNLRPTLPGEAYGPEIAAPNGPPAPEAVGAPPVRALRPADDYPYPPTPPRSIPNARMANAPNLISQPTPPPPPLPPSTRLRVTEPGLPPPPPLPRPRPSLAASEVPSEAPASLPAVKPPAPSAPSGPVGVEAPAALIE